MKVSKIILASLLGVVVVNSAIADDYEGARNRCKSKSDKIWVEKTHECIPENPCKDSKFEAYCNRMFKDVEVQDLGYKVLVEAYASTHDLECLPMDTKSKLVGQDYVVCMGEDVMVFEFDDVNEFAIGFDNQKRDAKYMWDKYPHVCRAIGGQSGVDNRVKCYDTTESNCSRLKSVLQKYLVDGGVRWEDNVCVMSIMDTNGAEYF